MAASTPQAHVRGGGEMGRRWYEDGKYLHKKNTFLDFIAAAEHLIKGRYTAPERLAVHGRSAGGLLIGAVCNMRPDLFKAAIAGVGALHRRVGEGILSWNCFLRIWWDGGWPLAPADLGLPLPPLPT
jgi:hypothetical protein